MPQTPRRRITDPTDPNFGLEMDSPVADPTTDPNYGLSQQQPVDDRWALTKMLTPAAKDLKDGVVGGFNLLGNLWNNKGQIGRDLGSNVTLSGFNAGGFAQTPSGQALGKFAMDVPKGLYDAGADIINTGGQAVRDGRYADAMGQAVRGAAQVVSPLKGAPAMAKATMNAVTKGAKGAVNFGLHLSPTIQSKFPGVDFGSVVIDEGLTSHGRAFNEALKNFDSTNDLIGRVPGEYSIMNYFPDIAQKTGDDAFLTGLGYQGVKTQPEINEVMGMAQGGINHYLSKGRTGLNMNDLNSERLAAGDRASWSRDQATGGLSASRIDPLWEVSRNQIAKDGMDELSRASGTFGSVPLLPQGTALPSDLISRQRDLLGLQMAFNRGGHKSNFPLAAATSGIAGGLMAQGTPASSFKSLLTAGLMATLANPHVVAKTANAANNLSRAVLGGIKPQVAAASWGLTGLLQQRGVFDDYDDTDYETSRIR
jgi:hypothetical protein